MLIKLGDRLNKNYSAIILTVINVPNLTPVLIVGTTEKITNLGLSNASGIETRKKFFLFVI